MMLYNKYIKDYIGAVQMLEFVKKIVAKQNDNANCGGVTVAFLGDSVTQGCFELYRKSDTAIETTFDKNCAYHNYFARIFTAICPSVPVNIINAGISGGTAPKAVERLQRDVLRHNPDLTVVCFGLNDSYNGIENINDYLDALNEIFDRVRETGSELIFLTPNMIYTEVSTEIRDEIMLEACTDICEKCNKDNSIDEYIKAAKELCQNKNIPVCDCYAKWKRMHECGIDINSLLANRINHPAKEMNWLFAHSLVETIFNAE